MKTDNKINFMFEIEFTENESSVCMKTFSIKQAILTVMKEMDKN